MIACGEDEGTEIDVTRLEARSADGWVARQRDRLLRDVAAGIPADLALDPIAVLARGVGHDHDAVAAEAGARLDHELVEPLERLVALRGIAQAVGGHRPDERPLPEAEAPPALHVGVHDLVVAEPAPDAVE